MPWFKKYIGTFKGTAKLCAFVCILGGNAEKLRLMPIFASAFNACHLCYYGGSQKRQLQTMNDSKTHDRCINSKSWFNPALGVDKIFACSSTLLFFARFKERFQGMIATTRATVAAIRNFRGRSWSCRRQRLSAVRDE